MFDSSFIDEIKFRNPIEDVVSSYVNLKKSGSNFMGLCPFHSEKTGSFTVFAGSRSFYCFGCGAGGDVITFIMKAENLDYLSAVEFLAKRVGMTVPDNNEKQYGDGITKERLWQMNKDAARYFRDRLFENKPAFDYLFGKRALSEKMVNHFGLGYAPDGFGNLTDFMKKKGYTDDELVAGYLCGISEKTGRTYDRFRNRVMFPIIDIYGNIIAFGGRVMDDSKPKYLNSSDTRIFKKSRNLFALNFAKNHSTDGFILCEGYMDVIALHEAGFENAVATLGTALTQEQARVIKHYTDKVVICYDSDEAGQKAAERAFGLLGEAGLTTRVIKVEGAKDPDEFIKKYGAEKFKDVIEGGRTEFEFKFDKILAENDINIPENKIRAASLTCTLIADFSSAVERDVYINKAAEKLKLPYDTIKADTEKIRKNRKYAQKRAEIKTLSAKMERDDAGKLEGNAGDLRIIRAEQAILGMLILYPELYSEYTKDGSTLTAEDFPTEFNGKVARIILENLDKGQSCDIGILGAYFDEAQIGRITRMTVNRERLINNDIKVFSDCVSALKAEKGKADMSLEDIINLKRSNLKKN